MTLDIYVCQSYKAYLLMIADGSGRVALETSHVVLYTSNP